MPRLCFVPDFPLGFYGRLLTFSAPGNESLRKNKEKSHDRPFLNCSAGLCSLAPGLRFWLGRFGRLIDRAVSARAARAVPEWQMKQVQSEITRHVRAGRLSRSGSGARSHR